MTTWPNAVHRGPRGGFPTGHSSVFQETARETGALAAQMDFEVVRLGPGEKLTETHAKESAWVLVKGSANLVFGKKSQRASVSRGSIFEEAPTALHVGPNTPVSIEASDAGSEWLLTRTSNDRSFEPHLFVPAELKPEYRGLGLVQNACLRNVRLIFDKSARPDANLVLGEVVNYPGRWSSYPPHHHDQVEIYHYRFTQPQGYGHAELGEEVVKVRDNDTIWIPPGLDHAQVSAPGYGMYYLWVIRHLPGNPYTGFTFTPDHTWTLDPKQQGWQPKDGPISAT